MAGLPHYRNSKASMNDWEPLYLNLFDLNIVFPAAVGSGEFVLDNVIKVGGLETDKVPETITQTYRGAKRTFAAGLVEDTGVNITIDFEVNLNDANSAYVYKTLKNWCNLIYDPTTGKMGVKKDYTGGPMIISAYNKNGDIYRQWKFAKVFPIKNINAMEFDYGTISDIFKIEGFELRADFWDEASL